MSALPAAMPLTAENRRRLANVSVATLTTLLFKRGLRNLQVQNVHPLNPQAATMVGEAFTLRYIPAREDIDVLEVFTDPEHPQRKAIETCPPGHVMMIDSRKDASGASAGGILVSRLMKRGAAGIVTDGGFRDSPEMSRMPFPIYHQRPAARTNLCMNHAVDINVPIACGDVPVFPGDIVVGDGEAVVVIPAYLANDLAEESVEMSLYEDFVQEEVMKGRAIVGLYPASETSRRDFAAWRAKR